MLEKPALTSKVDLPGARNRFEDFMGDHIRQTNDTHFVVSEDAHQHRGSNGLTNDI